MALIAAAETAEDVASGFHRFLEPVPEISTQITGLVSECFAISSALRELANAIQEPRNRGRYPNVADDVQMTVSSVDYTFSDVHRFFGGLGRSTHLSVSAGYRAVWREIEDHFHNESRNTLFERLEFYKRFLKDLTDIIIEGFAQFLRFSFNLSDSVVASPSTGLCSMISGIALTCS